MRWYHSPSYIFGKAFTILCDMRHHPYPRKFTCRQIAEKPLHNTEQINVRKNQGVILCDFLSNIFKDLKKKKDLFRMDLFRAVFQKSLLKFPKTCVDICFHITIFTHEDPRILICCQMALMCFLYLSCLCGMIGSVFIDSTRNLSSK